MSGASDDALLARARDGDAEAFRALVERYEGTVAATATGMLGPGDEAEDVGQETFIRFYESMGRFRGEAALGTYLTRIAMNLSLNALKRRRRWRDRFRSRDREDPPLPEPAGDARADVEAREDRALVRAAIDRLGPEHRAVVVLRLIEGRSTRETAEILGLPPGTVMSRLSRALGKLEADLRPLLGEP